MDRQKSLRKTMWRISWRLQNWIVPNLKYSQTLYEMVLNENVNSETIWLDMGCGYSILPPWRREADAALARHSKMIIGIDYDLPSLAKHATIDIKVRGDLHTLPLCDQSVDLVTANMVVEHLDDPVTLFHEVYRVLVPGGRFIFHTPNRYGYYAAWANLIPDWLKNKLVLLLQTRQEEDIFETHYLANTRSEVVRICKAAGLVPHQIRLINSSAQFMPIPPLVIFELLWIKLLMTKPFAPLRTNIIAIIDKPSM